MINKKVKNPQLFYIEWEDACAEVGWKDKEEIDDWISNKGLMVKQVGWLLSEGKTHYNFASRKSDEENDFMQYGNLIKIPKTWIRRKVNLTKHICPKKK